MITSGRHSVIKLVLAAIVGACGGEPSDPGDEAPTITVAGVADGDRVPGPVVINITVDVGGFTATLNGDPFFSGQSIEDPGDYTLLVEARNGTAESTEEIRFTILLQGESVLIVRFLDLGPNEAGGGGDAIILTDSSGAGLRHAMIDAGPAGNAGADPGFAARQLGSLGIDTLELLVLSHAHSDHFGGMLPVLDGVHVKRFLYNGQERAFSAYNSVLSRAQAVAEEFTVVTTPDTSVLGFGSSSAATVLVLPPLADFLTDANAGSSELNDGSLGIEVSKGPFRIFFAGDGEVMANSRWRLDFGPETENLEALKVGHHGANDAVFDNGFNGSSSWLDHTSPELAFISANGVTHPRLNALAELLSRVALEVFCTNTHGRIELRISESGDRVVSVERDVPCEAGSDATS